MWTSTNHSPMHYGAQAAHGNHKKSLCHYSNTVVAKHNTDTTKQVEP